MGFGTACRLHTETGSGGRLRDLKPVQLADDQQQPSKIRGSAWIFANKNSAGPIIRLSTITAVHAFTTSY